MTTSKQYGAWATNSNAARKPKQVRQNKLSISVKLLITMILVVVGTIGLCWLINNTFLEKYYIFNKQNQILAGFDTIDKAAESGELRDEDFDITFEKICSNGNISTIVIGKNHEIIRSSVNDIQLLQMQLSELIGGDSGVNYEEIKVTDNYALARKADSRLGEEYLILWGVLSDGSTIYMRSALESIRESADITNKFMELVGIFAALVCFVIIVFVSRTISRPIREITEISKKMSELDFEAKYTPHSNDSMEIAELGQHMNALSETLEETISELKSANIELEQDIRKKEEIDEMRKEFLSNVSHELKTPLALISGYAEGLKEGVMEDEESRNYYCEVIMDESDKMNTMVKKLLTLNQLEFGNDVVEISRFDMTELVRGVIASSSLLMEQNDISIKFEQKEPIYVWGDEFEVEEVITNYLSNAIHYAKNEKLIEISFEQRDAVLRTKVFNTGDQIPEDELDKVWIKFYKVDKARTREYGGSGIGLSIVKAIMDSFHQQCGVVNHDNGVEFWMELETNS